MKHTILTLLLLAGITLAGCSKDEPPKAPTPTNNATAEGTLKTPPIEPGTNTPVGGDKTRGECTNPPQFTFDWSPYLSWSTFPAASLMKLVDGKAGRLGPLEKRFCVDLVLRKAAYEATLASYGSNATDGLTVTNMDVLALAQGRRAVVIAPTSRSHGADGVLGAKNATSMKDLVGQDVYVLTASVSEYLLVRCAQVNGVDPTQLTLKMMAPDKIAIAMAGNDSAVRFGVLWNPELEQTKRERPDLHVICDSTSIENEIIDTVVVAQDALDRDGGERFAQLLVTLFYEFNKELANNDKAWRALSRNFLDLDVDTIKHLATKTQMYDTPERGSAAFAPTHLDPIMETVVSTWKERGHLQGDVSISNSDADTGTQLRFTTKYMKSHK